jgi:hypothetical protein
MAVVALAILELCLFSWTTRRAPRFDDYGALTEPFDALRQPEDGVVTAPRWAEPMVRAALGDGRIALEVAAPADLEGYAAVVEIASLGERAPGLGGWRELARVEVGDFVLRRLENPEPRPARFDFVSGLGPARVEVSMGAASCPWTERATVASGGLGGHPTFPARRFQCPGSSFYHVGVTVIADELFRPRRCLWAHPPPRGELSMRFRAVPLGEVLVGHTGLYWMVERERNGAPIELEVRVAGEHLGAVIHADGDGWSRFELPLGGHAGKTADVELLVSSPDHRHRHFCFEARTR